MKIYYVQVLNGIPDGKGIMEYKNGETYFGHFERGEKKGLGFCAYSRSSNAVFYAGDYKKNRQNGKGSKVWASGDLYYGDFKNDSRTGYGVYLWPNGDKYIGNHTNNKRNGQGTYYYSDGTKYEGNWVNHLQNGNGTLFSAARAVDYSGAWKDGKKKPN